MNNVAINGFGRIGRSLLRAYIGDALAQKTMKVVVLNLGPAKISDVVHMFVYDTDMGKFHGTVSFDGTYLHINDHAPIAVVAKLSPADINWGQYGVDWVVDATGAFTHKLKAMEHIFAGAKKVLISAPGFGVDRTIVPGVNDAWYQESDQIISLASCTTNALAPVLKVLHEQFGIQTAMMNTIHAYTNRQVLIDGPAKDLRLSRGATVNIIPAQSEAASQVDIVYPELAGKVISTSTRVPVAKVSLMDLTFTTTQKLSAAAVNEVLVQASVGSLQNIIGISSQELVSLDFANNAHSVIIDTLLTKTFDHTGKLFGWYDNEWGYSNRLKDFLASR